MLIFMPAQAGRFSGWKKPRIVGQIISSGNPQWAEDFLAVLRYLKSQHLKLQLGTNRRTVAFSKGLEEELAQLVIMNVLGLVLYQKILGEELISRSGRKHKAPPLCSISISNHHRPGETGKEKGLSYLTPEIGETARLIN